MSSSHVSQSGAVIKTCEGDEVCEVVSCEVCLSEIPDSVAQSIEGPDYVHHFCGLECLEVWHKKTAKTETEETEKK